MSILQLIEKRVDLTPDATALIFENQSITYRELDDYANRLAHYLRRFGLGPEKRIGICISRSIEMVVSILGILKAGAAYVPIDPSYPPSRIDYLIKDSGIECLIVDNEFSAAKHEGNYKKVVLVDGDSRLLEESVERLPEIVKEDDLAYVIYTSGSTGKPKGVMVTHGNLVNFVDIANSVLDVCSKDVYLHSASISYALAVRQLMVPLSMGATIVIAAIYDMSDPIAMFSLIKRYQITLMDVVPSFWRACIQALLAFDEKERKNLLENRLRRIVSVGEPLPYDIPVDWWYRVGHRTKMVNIFGQTETTGVVCTYEIPSPPDNLKGKVPIGKPAPRTQVLILDEHFFPVTPGETGELCISNPCVAKGYLNQEGLTDQKFIEKLIEGYGLLRLYRTGDMACELPDGSIEFLGRSDHQVKIRGQRLELGEVESILYQHPEVQSCACGVLLDESQNQVLVAYIKRKNEDSASSVELRSFSRKFLPDFMVPTYFFYLNEFPKTPNGKLDRISLSQWGQTQFTKNKTYEGDAAFYEIGSTESADNINKSVKKKGNSYSKKDLEVIIHKIWSDIFQENISYEDDFFNLGGNSFLAVRFFSLFEKATGIRLPLTTLFHTATISSLANLIDASNSKLNQYWSLVVPIQSRGAKPSFFAIHALEGGILFWRELVTFLADDQPFFGIQARGVDGLQAPLTDICEMASVYIHEMKEIQPHGPYYLGGYSMGGEIAFEMAHQLNARGESIALLVLFDTYNPENTMKYAFMGNCDELHGDTIERSKIIKRLAFFKETMGGHLRKLKTKNFLEQISYISHEIFYRIRRVIILGSAACFRTLNIRLPDILLLNYLRESHQIAVNNYIPMAFPGRVTLFRSSTTLTTNPICEDVGWSRLALGGLETYIFNSDHQILDKGNARKVAKVLEDCLEKSIGTTV